MLLRGGSSLGGARPKAHVVNGNGKVAIAKFPSAGDGWEVTRWEERLSTAVADDADARAYVGGLEARYDSETEQQVSSGEDLAAELERFLREQRGDG